MEEIKKYFITSNSRGYKEGEVNVFLQKFDIDKKVKKATLYMTALGIYEIEMNGQKVGEQLFAPGFTYYHRDLFFQEYDVNEQILQENNQLKVYVGQGWYSGRFTHENITKIYGDKTAISWILDIEFDDGSVMKKVSNTDVIELSSKYKYAGFYDGEIYNEASEESPIGTAQKYLGKVPENIEKTIIPVKIQEEIAIHKVIKKDNKTIIDFGQNFAGIIEIDSSYLAENSTIKVRHAELLTEDEELYTANLRSAKAEIVYTAGKNNRKYRPRFTYMGFRYIEISGCDYKPNLVRAYAIYSEMNRTGFFKTSHPKIQRLFENQLWGQKSNYVEVPTDCPQRDERQGYTGDGQVFALTGSYNFDTEKFWSKFLKDIHYSQLDNSEGYVGATIPANGPSGIGFLSMLGWGNAITIIPEMLHQQYGKDEYLEKYYLNMKKFIDAEIRQLGDDHLWLEVNLGDWLMQGKDITWMASNHGPVSNSFIVNDLKIVTKLAEKYGFKGDQAKYSNYLEKVQNAYIETFVKKDGTILGDYQGAYIMALRYVLDDENLRQKVFEKLVKNIRNHGLQTGFFSTEFILPLLVDSGEIKLAYDILLSEDYPSWLYQVNNGATTMWERWDAIKEDGSVNEEVVSTQSENMVSFNHYAFGSVGKFYYQYILGITPLEPGYKRIKLRPFIDKRLNDASGTYNSRAGEIYSSWEFDNEIVRFSFETPSEAIIELPDGSQYEVKAGKHSYQIENNK